jgi:hypothetical protein
VANVFSARFFAFHAGAGATYTVPAGYRLVLKSVTGFNANALVPQAIQVTHQPSNATLIQRSLGPQSDVQVALSFVADAGEQLVGVGGADVDGTASGYLLTLP